MDEQKTGQYFSQQHIAGLPGPLEILKEAWLIYKSRIWVFLGITIIPSLAIFFLMIPFLGIGFLGSSGAKESFIGFFSFWLVLFGFIAIVIQSWAQVALIYAIKESQERIGIKESYKKAFSNIVPFIWVSFLSGIIVMAGFILLIVPGIIFGLWFSFAIFILIDEGLRGKKALLRSKEYVQDKMGSIFWRLIFIGLIMFFLVFVLSYVIGDFITPIISLFITPLITTYYFLVYKKVKETKSVKQY